MIVILSTIRIPYQHYESNEPEEVYCYKKCKIDSNPNTRIHYDYINKYYLPAGMNFDEDRFDYGEWSMAWFIHNIHVVMLGYDGKIKYEIDKNDYSKKIDGTDSDINNPEYPGNVMIAVPTVYIKREIVGVWEYHYFSNKPIDAAYKAWAHTDVDGNILPYIYYPAYNGSLIDTRLRSMSDQTILYSKTRAQEVEYVKANNQGSVDIWDTETVAQWMLLVELLTLISCSTDGQSVFGYGHYSGGTGAGSLLKTGTMNDKGLFWGSHETFKGVKVFGIENFYGNIWRALRGYIYKDGSQYVKFTRGMQDGSSVNDYNFDGTGYIKLENSTVTGTNGSYISKMLTNEKFGMFPKEASGTQSTFECDGCHFNSGTMCAEVGGTCGRGFACGPFCVALNVTASSTGWHLGASPSCTPYLSIEESDSILQSFI